MATTTQLEPARVVEPIELQSFHDSTRRESRRSSANNPSPVPQDAPEGDGLDGATVLKLMAAAFSFFMSGISDGSIGPLIPYIIREYNLSTAIVSIMYVPNPVLIPSATVAD